MVEPLHSAFRRYTRARAMHSTGVSFLSYKRRKCMFLSRNQGSKPELAESRLGTKLGQEKEIFAELQVSYETTCTIPGIYAISKGLNACALLKKFGLLSGSRTRSVDHGSRGHLHGRLWGVELQLDCLGQKGPLRQSSRRTSECLRRCLAVYLGLCQSPRPWDC